jgi:hypothetical protein
MTALYVRIRSLWETTLTRFKKVLSDEKGATVAEYALSYTVQPQWPILC